MSDDRIHVHPQGSPLELLNSALDGGAHHVVSQASSFHRAELESANVILSDSSKYFEFPLSVILRPKAVGAAAEKELAIFDMPFHRSTEKHEVLKDLHKKLKNLRQLSSFIDDVILSADELFMNAIYNAPFVSQGRKVDRTEKVVLPMKPAGRMAAGSDGQRLVLVCDDFYGTLNIQSTLTRLRDCYLQGVDKMVNFGRGGAGIGNFMIFNSCTSIYFGVKKNSQTTISCVFPLNQSFKQRQLETKSLHYVYG